jgi:hypothetical protein
VWKKVTSPKKGGRRREPGLFRPHSHSPSESPGQRDRSPWRVRSSASTTVLSDAALRPARWRASSYRVTAQAPRVVRPRASAASAMLAYPSTELVARAPCQLRRAHAQPVRAARARLRQQRRLRSTSRASATFKRGCRTGSLRPETRAGTFLLALSLSLSLLARETTPLSLPFALYCPDPVSSGEDRQGLSVCLSICLGEASQ